MKDAFNFSENHRIMNSFGRRTKFTWRSSGVTYLARDALDEPLKNEIYFLCECQLPLWSCL